MFSVMDTTRNPFVAPSTASLVLTQPFKFSLRTFYRVLNYLRSAPRPSDPPLRIVCISDTHCQTLPIPDGDLLIHAGDMTTEGTVSQIRSQLEWLATLPHPYKIVISGNHDTYMDPRSRRTLSIEDRTRTLDLAHWETEHGIHYLRHGDVKLVFPSHGNRSLRVYGAPQIPACGGADHAFQYTRGQDAWTETVPDGIDILVTHTPPKYHRDIPIPDGMGCEWLLKELWRVKPRLHVCGHVHADPGKDILWWNKTQKAYERALGRKRLGLIWGWINIGFWKDLFRVVWHGTSGVIWDKIWGGEERATILVNAALFNDTTQKLESRVQVVEL